MPAGVAIAALGLLALTTAADAHRAPTKSESAAISAAIHRTHAGIRRGLCFHVRNIVISTAGPWSRARLVRCRDGHRFDTALAVLQRSHGKWRVRDVGTADIGCTVAPARVRRDLRLLCT
jgi:hypothetical protein